VLQNSNKYTFFFASIICVVLSICLSATYMLLKDRQDFNRAIDKQKNILLAAGIVLNDAGDINDMFKNIVDPVFTDIQGNAIEESAYALLHKEDAKHFFPLFKIKQDIGDNKINCIVYPIEGKGLWSTMYGYLAVTKDGRNINGITFYKQGETPGLGAEIEKKWFCDNFINKQLYKNDKIVGVKVAKGKASNSMYYKTEYNHLVDGISGATITCNGITKMMYITPMKYFNFFKKYN